MFVLTQRESSGGLQPLKAPGYRSFCHFHCTGSPDGLGCHHLASTRGAREHRELEGHVWGAGLFHLHARPFHWQEFSPTAVTGGRGLRPAVYVGSCFWERSSKYERWTRVSGERPAASGSLYLRMCNAQVWFHLLLIRRPLLDSSAAALGGRTAGGPSFTDGATEAPRTGLGCIKWFTSDCFGQFLMWYFCTFRIFTPDDPL